MHACLAGVVAFFLLFFVGNVFDQEVSRMVHYRFDSTVGVELSRRGIEDPGLARFQNQRITNSVSLNKELEKKLPFLDRTFRVEDTESKPRH